jgi:hypothetical protein
MFTNFLCGSFSISEDPLYCTVLLLVQHVSDSMETLKMFMNLMIECGHCNVLLLYLLVSFVIIWSVDEEWPLVFGLRTHLCSGWGWGWGGGGHV